jgi:hypothetical protein
VTWTEYASPEEIRDLVRFAAQTGSRFVALTEMDGAYPLVRVLLMPSDPSAEAVVLADYAFDTTPGSVALASEAADRLVRSCVADAELLAACTLVRAI